PRSWPRTCARSPSRGTIRSPLRSRRSPRSPRSTGAHVRSSPGLDLLFDLLPPLTPPLRPDQDAQLGMPAVGDLLVAVHVEAAAAALLFAIRLPAQDRVLGQVTQLKGELLVDLFRLGARQLIIGHARYPNVAN